MSISDGTNYRLWMNLKYVNSKVFNITINSNLVNFQHGIFYISNQFIPNKNTGCHTTAKCNSLRYKHTSLYILKWLAVFCVVNTHPTECFAQAIRVTFDSFQTGPRLRVVVVEHQNRECFSGRRISCISTRALCLWSHHDFHSFRKPARVDGWLNLLSIAASRMFLKRCTSQPASCDSCSVAWLNRQR